MATDSPLYEQALTYHAREDRRQFDRLPIQPGVVNSGDFKITPVSGLVLQAAAGDAWIAGSHAGVSRQGLYSAGLGAAEGGITVTTANATNPRIDQVILRMRDVSPAPATAGDAENSGKLEVVAGTATAGATLDNRTGAAALPASCIRLADILVPAAFAGPFVQNTHIRDRRPWAFGANFRNVDTTANVSLTLGAMVAVGAIPRIECSGAPLIVQAYGTFEVVTAESALIFGVKMDGTFLAPTERRTRGILGSGNFFAFAGEWELAPSAGSHTFQFWASESVNDIVLSRTAAQPLYLKITERLIQDVQNAGA